MQQTYTVVRTFFLRGQQIDPAPEGAPPKTVTLTEREARYLVLEGALKAASNATQSPVEAPVEG